MVPKGSISGVALVYLNSSLVEAKKQMQILEREITTVSKLQDRGEVKTNFEKCEKTYSGELMLKHTSTTQSLIELLRGDSTKHHIDTTTMTTDKMNTNVELKKTLR